MSSKTRNPLRTMRHVWRIALASVITGTALACTPALQRSPGVAPVPDPSPPPMAVDTTPAAEGYTDFSRYDTPAACERAVYHIRARTWRAGERDTLRYSPELDTFPTSAVEAGRLCAEKFTVESVSPDQLFYLARLSLIIGNDDQARQAILRRLMNAPDTAEQAKIGFESLQMYLDAKPARLADAEALLTNLDAMGLAARVGRLQSHHAMLSHYALLFDIPNMERNADSILAINETLTPEERDQIALLLPAAYYYRAAIQAFRDSPASAIQIFQEALNALGNLRGGQLRQSIIFTRQHFIQLTRLYGTPAQPLTGHYWYNTGDSTTRPSPGKISLLLQGAQNCGQFCYAQYAMIRRIHQQYAEQGVEITMVVRTVGYSQNTGVQTPAEEVESIRKYFMEDQSLPMTLVVQESPFTTGEDGRRVNGPTQFDEMYRGAYAVLVDRNGNIRWNGLLDLSQEAVIDAYIQKLIAEQ